jgi:hypothetical protein
MSYLRPTHGSSLALALVLLAPICLNTWSGPATEGRLDGLNVIVAPGHPFGSDSAKRSLANAKGFGARAIAVIPFLRQLTPASPKLQRNTDTTDAELHTAIRDPHGLGLAVLLKPQVLVAESWAGAVAMTSPEDWAAWFANYRRELENFARIAAEEKAEALVIGTELAGTEQRLEWSELISAARELYAGRLLYMAHNAEEAEAVPFWDRLDSIGVTLYPPLGPDADRQGRRATMRATADRLAALAARRGKHVVVGEIGLRSAVGAAAKPWESPEEHDSTPDPALQAEVIADWLAALDRPSIDGVLIWRWLTDPDAGGLDTDFTVQNKPAEHVLMCVWKKECEETDAAIQAP